MRAATAAPPPGRDAAQPWSVRVPPPIPSDLQPLLRDWTIERADTTLSGAPAAGVPYLLARLQTAGRRPVVAIVADDDRARQLATALDTFLPPEGDLPAACVYPALDVSPYAGISPSRAAAMERVACLFRLVHGLLPRIVIAPVRALQWRTIERGVLLAAADLVIAGERLERDAFIENLVGSGYSSVPAVEDAGTYAVRGGVLDVFTPLYPFPLRIDLWGDDVESIRLFDPQTQRSLRRLREAFICPAREALLNTQTSERALAALRRLGDACDLPTARLRALSDEIRHGILGVGMEFLLPALYDNPSTLLDFVSPESLLFVEEPEALHGALEAADAALAAQWLAAGAELQLAHPPGRHFEPAARVRERLAAWPRLGLRAVVLDEPEGAGRVHRREGSDHRALTEALTHQPAGSETLKPLADAVRRWQRDGLGTVVACHTRAQQGRLKLLLGGHGLRVAVHEEEPRLPLLEGVARDNRSVHLTLGAVGAGFVDPPTGLVLLDEGDLFGPRPARRRGATAAPAGLRTLVDLRPGDFVVHVEHGIGRFAGLVKLATGGIESDFLDIRYRDTDKLFLPVHQLRKIERYAGAGQASPALDKLGGVTWERVKARVRGEVRALAEGLVRLYAARQALPGHAFAPPDDLFRAFEATFPYEETPDQSRAIEEVLADLQTPRPMDRLVVGDAGYGKTEVALRAAARVALEGKQVAVLVPTTVLAEQHYRTFQARLANFPLHLDVLSRFKSAPLQREVLQRLAAGQCDIVIGTHRLLQKDIRFKDLGLLIIDEEHRFGVAHKEKLKQFRNAVDVLALTATPIPRTLFMSLAGLRDLTVIATPPRDRLAVRTIVTRESDAVVREAILREVRRGGQVFFVHNRVQTIEKRAEGLRQLVPEARFAVAHGQTPEHELEDVMLRFVRGELHVLVCTTIVESGLDIPQANTLIVDRADRFGLAQLYQIRGRVGRGSERAYAYFLIPNPTTLDGEARERIAAIQRFSELGAGYMVANYDLELRGAGNLLGAAQHGHIDLVGLELYQRMLDEAIRELRGETPGTAGVDTELKVALPAYLPEDWVPDETERLRLYREAAAADGEAELDALEKAWEDRFGVLPEAVRNLLESMRLRWIARGLGIAVVAFSAERLAFQLTADGALQPERLLPFLNRAGNRYRLSPDAWLSRAVGTAEWAQGLPALRAALYELLRVAGAPAGR